MVSLILFWTFYVILTAIKTWEIHARIHFKSFVIFAYTNSLVNSKKEKKKKEKKRNEKRKQKKKTKQTQIFQIDSGNRWRFSCKTRTYFYWYN